MQTRSDQLKAKVIEYGAERARAEAGVEQGDMDRWLSGERVTIPGYGLNALARVVGFPLDHDDNLMEAWATGRNPNRAPGQ